MENLQGFWTNSGFWALFLAHVCTWLAVQRAHFAFCPLYYLSHLLSTSSLGCFQMVTGSV